MQEIKKHILEEIESVKKEVQRTAQTAQATIQLHKKPIKNAVGTVLLGTLMGAGGSLFLRGTVLAPQLRECHPINNPPNGTIQDKNTRSLDNCTVVSIIAGGAYGFFAGCCKAYYDYPEDLQQPQNDDRTTLRYTSPV
jgi:hypothetical protein